MGEAPGTEFSLDDLVGRTLEERYRIDSLLGVGGMGAVFSAHHLLLKRDVALKVLHPELSTNEELSQRFDREAQCAARLEHPNVVHVTEYGATDEGMKYMVMQLLSGGELHELLGTPLGPERVVELARQILRGLAHAHDNGVVHRDLKPENVFVTTDHEGEELLKLVDFGIAKLLGEEEETGVAPLTRMGLVFGTPHYMSPEQATGSEIDHRTDLYAAGIIFYEMLNGTPPFDADDPVALVRMQVSLDPPPLPDSVPGELREFVMCLLAKDRNERYETATAALDALESLDLRAESGPSAPLDDQETEPAARSLHQTAPELSSPSMSEAKPSNDAPKWRLPAAAAGGSLAILLGLFAMRGGDDAERDLSAATGGISDSDSEKAPVPGAGPEQLAEVDKLLLAKNASAALEQIRPLRDLFPTDPELLWREGRAWSLSKGKKDVALERYASALDLKPALLDNQEFYSELDEILGVRSVRTQAIDVALQKMGERGHRFLIGLLNEQAPRKALGYKERHRILDALSTSADAMALVDERLNLVRDLYQSKQADRPCEAHEKALAKIEAKPERYFAPHVNAKLPKKPADDTDAALCTSLEPRITKLEAELKGLEEAADAQGENPSSQASGEAQSPGGGSGQQGKSGGSSEPKPVDKIRKKLGKIFDE